MTRPGSESREALLVLREYMTNLRGCTCDVASGCTHAWDEAEMLKLLDSLPSGVSRETPAEKCAKCGEPFTSGQAYFAAVHVSCVRSTDE